jgi:hypothetical protein
LTTLDATVIINQSFNLSGFQHVRSSAKIASGLASYRVQILEAAAPYEERAFFDAVDFAGCARTRISPRDCELSSRKEDCGRTAVL